MYYYICYSIGNIDISEYDLSNKYVFNINNENNYDYYTAITYLSNQQSIINLIRAIYYGFFYGGFITIDLNDIAISINGRIQYKRYSKNDMQQIFKDFDLNGSKKKFIIFEEPANSNSDLFELNDIIDTLKYSYEKCDFYFAVPGISEAKELFINVFYGD